MFRSSENLRLAADMRALARVAAPWRAARTSWFDGTPESIEARLAATERVLSYAQGGLTPAHLELAREASAARAELREASHRLMVDFLDDSARAFKGSKRVAFGHDSGPLPSHEDRFVCPDCGDGLHVNDADAHYREHYPEGFHDDHEWKDREYASRLGSRRVAAPTGYGDEDDEAAFRPGHEPDYERFSHDWDRYQQREKINREWQDSVRGKERDKWGDIIEGDPHGFDENEVTRYSSRRTADESTGFGSTVDFDIDPSDWEDLHELQQQHEFENRLNPGSHRDGDFDECPTCHETTDPETLELARRYKQSR